MRVSARVAWLLFALAAAWLLSHGGLDIARALLKMTIGTPHERYAAQLELGFGADDRLAAAWLARADASLRDPRPVALPHRAELMFRAGAPDAAAFEAPLRRGQRLVVDVNADAGGPAPIFLDAFLRDEGNLRRVGGAPRGGYAMALDLRADGDYVVRVQPALGRDVPLVLAQRTEPTLRVPVDGATAADIRSAYGAPRDAGRRAHEGIDIFARRGTNVLAAADGIVSSVGTNRLGGNVVWVWRPGRGESHYYAHLDTQAVAPGTRVGAGDVLGTVGNTGNARGGPPHLHFGIYAAGGAVDPLPYVADF